MGYGVGGVGGVGCGPVGGFGCGSALGIVLVLFILLVIILRGVFF
nr:sporulation protein YjcZ [Paenibacillus artemisiicola]